MNKKELRKIRHKRIRGKIRGTKERPRLCVFRSNRYLTGQIIDDEKNVTLIGMSTNCKEFKKQKNKITKTEEAALLGEALAKKALKNGIKKIVFDRSGYKYHGRVKALAEGARKAGLEF